MRPMLHVSTTLRKIRLTEVEKKKRQFWQKDTFQGFPWFWTNVIEKQHLVTHSISCSLPTNLKMRNRKRKIANKVSAWCSWIIEFSVSAEQELIRQGGGDSNPLFRKSQSRKREKQSLLNKRQAKNKCGLKVVIQF